jgi:hypothetical protein
VRDEVDATAAGRRFGATHRHTKDGTVYSRMTNTTASDARNHPYSHEAAVFPAKNLHDYNSGRPSPVWTTSLATAPGLLVRGDGELFVKTVK